MNPHPILTATLLHVTLVVELGLAPLHHLPELPQLKTSISLFKLASYFLCYHQLCGLGFVKLKEIVAYFQLSIHIFGTKLQ